VTTLTIQELMRPLDQFPRISAQALFHDVMDALDQANAEYLSGVSKQRLLLVENSDGTILGKISPKDVLRSLEPQYDKINSFKDDIRFGLPQLVETMKRDFLLWQDPLGDLCRKAAEIRADKIMSRPSPVQGVKISDRIDNAFHLFATTGHDSLYVTQDDEIIGLLRFTDIYAAIRKTVQACAAEQGKA